MLRISPPETSGKAIIERLEKRLLLSAGANATEELAQESFTVALTDSGGGSTSEYDFGDAPDEFNPWGASSAVPHNYDFGDAPDESNLWGASSAAHHSIVPGFFLGQGVDAEEAAQPDLLALGDDSDGNDDEDGVTFTSPLIPGALGTVDVVASAPGKLDAWIDFNAGGWGYGCGPADRIFESEELVAGVNSLTFAVPGTAAQGVFTYARFRFSTQGGCGFIDSAPDGEVEDYRVEILNAVDLLEPYDTGVYDNDNITNLDNSSPSESLQFLVRSTEAGATVTIYADGMGIGSAVATDTTTIVTTDGSYDLVDGSHTITARQTQPGEPESPDSAPLEMWVDTIPPAPTEVVVNRGAWQRSRIMEISTRFSENVGDSLTVSDMTMWEYDGVNAVWVPVDLTGAGMSYDTDHDTAVWDLSNVALNDAYHRMTLSGSGITDTAGNELDANGDGIGGDDYTFQFHKLSGDANGDAAVGVADLGIVGASYGSNWYWWDLHGDLNADGTVNVGDLGVLGTNYGAMLTPLGGGLGCGVMGVAGSGGPEPAEFKNTGKHAAGEESMTGVLLPSTSTGTNTGMNSGMDAGILTGRPMLSTDILPGLTGVGRDRTRILQTVISSDLPTRVTTSHERIFDILGFPKVVGALTL